MINEKIQLTLPDFIPNCRNHGKLLYYFVADSAFPLKTYILKPFAGTCLTEDRCTFNYHFARARCAIGNTFGIMATKFQNFHQLIIAKSEDLTLIT